MYCLEKLQKELAYFLDKDLRDLPKVQELLSAQGYTAIQKGESKNIPQKTEIPINPQIQNHLNLESNTLKADLEKLKNTHPELLRRKVQLQD